MSRDNSAMVGGCYILLAEQLMDGWNESKREDQKVKRLVCFAHAAYLARRFRPRYSLYPSLRTLITPVDLPRWNSTNSTNK